jgi:penicillin amidase
MIAYADGVNAWISSMKRQDLPIEFRLLSVEPFKWEPIYTVYFFAKMALTLGFNDATFSRLAAQAKVGRAAADALYPVNSPIQEPIQPNGLTAPRYDLASIPGPGAPDSAATVALALNERMFAAFATEKPNANGDALGSNNWAVSPQRTRKQARTPRRRSASRPYSAFHLVRDAHHVSRQARCSGSWISRSSGCDHRIQS